MQQPSRSGASAGVPLPLALLLGLLVVAVAAAGTILSLTASPPPAPAAVPISPRLTLNPQYEESFPVRNPAAFAVAAAEAASEPARPPLSAVGAPRAWLSLPFAWPARGQLSTLFWEEGPYWIGGHHQGLDIANQEGEAVRAASGGVVVAASAESSRGYGTHIVVDHGYGVETLYAHLSALEVEVGQQVERGDLIGRLGNTGYSFGAHLHFELHVDGALVDPLLFLPDFPGRGLGALPHWERAE